MEKKFKSFAALLLAASLTFTSCEKNEDPVPVTPAVEAKDIDYNSENAASWGNYMQNVSSLLKKDAANLYSYWDYRGSAWEKNNGILLDHLFLSPVWADKLISSNVDSETRGVQKASDHAPVRCLLSPI